MKSTLLWIQALCLLVLTLIATACSDSGSSSKTTDAGTTVTPATISVSQGTTAIAADATVKLAGTVLGTPATTLFTIKNTGDEDLSISSVLVGGADFSLNDIPKTTVASGKSTTFALKFAPLTVGTKTATVTVTSNNAEDFAFLVSAAATAVPAPVIVVSDGTIDIGADAVIALGSTTIGTPLEKTLTVSNTGSAELSLTSVTADNGEFAVTAAPAATVKAGESTTFTLKFAPTTVGAKSSRVVIANSATKTFSFSASATALAAPATAAPAIEVKQGSVAIAANATATVSGAAIGTPTETTFTVNNVGTAELAISSVTVSGTGFSISQTAATTVAVGGSTTFNVKFDPTTAGTKVGLLTIANNTASPFNFTVLGIASAKPAAAITVLVNDATIGSAGTLAFGSLVAGTTLDKTVTVKNIGSADLVLASNPVVAGSVFTLKTPPASLTVAAGASTTFVVSFAPTTSGIQAGSLTIANNTTDIPSYLINLTGYGFVNVAAINVTSVGGVSTITASTTRLQLLADVIPANAEKALTWTSGTPTVATVDANGLVTPVANGTAVITATAADGSFVTGSFTVTNNIPFVYFVKQAQGTTTATMTSGVVSVAAAYGASGNAFKYVAPNYYGTNSNGFISFPSLMSGDFSIEADVTMVTQNKANNACGIGVGITTGYNATDSYAYILMRNSSNVANGYYVSAAGAQSAGSPSVAFTNGTPMKLVFKREGTNLTYGAGPVGGTMTMNTAAITYFTNGTVYGGNPVYPTVSFNNVVATVTNLIVKDATGATVFNSATGLLTTYIPAALTLAPTAIAIKKGTTGTVTATANAVAGAVATVSAVSTDPTIATVSVANNATNSTITVTGVNGGVTTVTVTNDADTNTVTKTRTFQVAVNDYATSDPYGTLSTQLYPATGATDVYTDGELAITFDSAPTLNAGGSIKIFKQSDGTEVDSITFTGETQTFGTTALNVGTQLVRTSGNTLFFTPHLGKLAYATGYYVVIPTTSITGTLNTVAFNGFSDDKAVKTWNFTTRADPTSSLNYTNITVDGAQTSTANFRTVQGALNAIAAATTAPTSATINVAAGTYYELLRYTGPGATVNQTINITGPVGNTKGGNCTIQWTNGNNMNGATQTRASFYFTGANLVLQNITLKNTGVRATVAQAETLYFASGGNFTLAAYNSSFISKQDTLQTSGRNWFYKCYIEGNVDYIWGTASAALFEDCDMRTVNDTTANTYSLVVARTGTTIGASANGTVGKGYVVWKSRLQVDDTVTQSFGRDAGTGSFYDQVALIDVAFTSTTANSTTALLKTGFWDIATAPLKMGDASYVGWKSTGCTWQGAAIVYSSTAAGTSSTIANQSSEYDTRDHILNRVVTVTAGAPTGYEAVSLATTATTTWDTSALATAWSAP